MCDDHVDFGSGLGRFGFALPGPSGRNAQEPHLQRWNIEMQEIVCGRAVVDEGIRP